MIVVLGQGDQDNILQTGVYETTGTEGRSEEVLVGAAVGGGAAIDYDDEYTVYDYGEREEGAVEGEHDEEDEEGGSEYGTYYDYDYDESAEGKGLDGAEDDYTEEDETDGEEDASDRADTKDYQEELDQEYEPSDNATVEASSQVENEDDYSGEDYDDESNDIEEQEYDNEEEEEEEDYDEEEENSDDYDAEELLYRNYEILSDFYKKHFVDLRVLDTTCDPEEVPPPKVQHGRIKEYKYERLNCNRVPFYLFYAKSCCILRTYVGLRRTCSCRARSTTRWSSSAIPASACPTPAWAICFASRAGGWASIHTARRTRTPTLETMETGKKAAAVIISKATIKNFVIDVSLSDNCLAQL